MSNIGSAAGTTSSLSGSYAQLIEALLAPEKAAIAKVQAKQADIATSQGILSDLGSKLSALRTTLDSLRGTGSLSPLAVFTSTTGNAQVVDATASGGASRGTHQITISQLAKAHTVASTGFVKTGTSFAAGNYALSLTVAGVTTQVNVTVTAGDSDSTVLSNVAQAVNASGAKVNGSVITTDSTTGTQKLILQSATAGTVNLISNVADTTGGLAAQLGVAGASSVGAYSSATLQQAQDAKFNLDGVDLVASTNQVGDALSGVTLNLKAETAVPIQLSFSSDSTSARKVVDSFLTQYNDLVGYLRAKSSVSDDGKTRGQLAGNSTVRSFQDKMLDIVSGSIAGAVPGAPSALADLGISEQRGGTLAVTESTKLATALDANPAQVIAIFSGDIGVAGQLYHLVDDFNGSNGGLSIEGRALTDHSTELSSRVSSLNDRLTMRRAQLAKQFSRLQSLASHITQLQQQVSTILSG